MHDYVLFTKVEPYNYSEEEEESIPIISAVIDNSNQSKISNYMEEENTGGKILNSKVGWLVGGFGIPLAAIITWVFSAGQLSYITNQNAQKVVDLDTRIRTIESIEARRDEQYREITTRLAELHDDMRNLLNAKQPGK